MFAYVEHSRSSASSSASNTAASAGTASTSIDPATGFPYGSPQDLAALSATSSSSIDPQTGFPYGSPEDEQALESLDGADDGFGVGGFGGGTSDIDPLTGDIAGSSQDISALEALYGTASLGTTATGTGTTATAPTAPTAPAPPTAPPASPPAAPPKAPAPTVHPAPKSYSDTPSTTFVDLGWGSAGTGLTYHYQVLSASGAVVQQADTTALNARVQGLKPKTAYKWRVSATPNGLWTPFVSFTTKS